MSAVFCSKTNEILSTLDVGEEPDLSLVGQVFMAKVQNRSLNVALRKLGERRMGQERSRIFVGIDAQTIFANW